MALRGTLNSRLHKVQTPTAGIVPSHLATLRLRFATIRSKVLQTISEPEEACDTRHTVGHIAGDGFDGESGCNAQRGNFSVADKLAFLTSTRLCVRIVQFDQTLDQCCSRWKVFQSVGYFVKRHAISDP